MTTSWISKFGLVLCVAAFLSLSACDTVKGFIKTEEPQLEGERVSVLQLQKDLEPEDELLGSPEFIPPTPWRNEFWPQPGGYPNHAMQSLHMSESKPNLLWTGSIGKGGSDALPLTAQPVVVNGMIFALDADSTLSAIDTQTGKKIWSANLRTPDEEEPVTGGGIAFSSGRLFVTAGYDEVVSLDPGTGQFAWRAAIPAPSRAAPTVMDGRVFVSTLDNRILALNADTGEISWEYQGINESAGLLGAASPAANHDIVVPAFSSGEIFALRVENGSVAWAENLSPVQRAGGLSSLADIRGLPVLDRGLVVAISFGGRIVAIDERSGQRVWQRDIGGTETPWVAGNRIFLVSSESQLVSLERESGAIDWVMDLPRYEDENDLKNPIYWTGPVLAGGRLVVVGSHGRVLSINPYNGEEIRSWKTVEGVRIAPVVAGGTLYLLAQNGSLMAYE